MQTILEVLKKAKQLFDEALPKFDWRASALDVNAITLLNTVPTLVAKAIETEPTVYIVSQFYPSYEQMIHGIFASKALAEEFLNTASSENVFEFDKDSCSIDAVIVRFTVPTKVDSL